MRRAWLRGVAPLALCALALSACSDNDSDSDSDAAESSPVEQSEAPSSPPADEPSEVADEESAPATEEDQGPVPDDQPGGERKEGESGIRSYEEDDGKKPTYEIVAKGVDVGTNADAREMLGKNADQAKDTLLAVVKMEFTNRSGVSLSYPKADKETKLTVDGRPAASLITFGGEPPEGCDRAVRIREFPQGESHVLCRIFLIPPTAKSMEVSWGKDDPFVWRFNR